MTGWDHRNDQIHCTYVQNSQHIIKNIIKLYHIKGRNRKVS